MKKVVKITGCRRECTFYEISMDGMGCAHPHWDDKGAYDNMIITQDNSRGGKIPEKCPLRVRSLTVKYRL